MYNALVTKGKKLYLCKLNSTSCLTDHEKNIVCYNNCPNVSDAVWARF